MLQFLRHQTRRTTFKNLRSLCLSTKSIPTDEKERILQPVIEKPSTQPSLDIPLEGLPPLKKASQLQAPKMQQTVLSNGLRVVSQETYGQAATLGLFIEAGSRYENDANCGVSHMLEHLCFKSTTNRTHAEIVREMEDIGGSITAIGGREQLVLSIDVLRDYVDRAVELLADSVSNPVLVESEIQGIHNILGFELEGMKDNPQGIIQEKIHQAAYGLGTPLGRPAQAPLEQIPRLTSAVVKDFIKENFVAPRMVLAGGGLDHSRLVGLAEKWFTNIPSGNANAVHATEKSVYKGGEVRISEPMSELSYASLAFDTASWHDEDLVPACVLQMLLGGGDSFSAGGPGKGMYSRLYTTVLNRYYWVESAQAFTSIHDDAGLFGINGASLPANSSNLIAVLCNQMLRVATELPHPVELSRAKNQLKSSVLMNLESRMILYEDIGRQMLTYGRREEPEAICAKIDAVTGEDLLRVGQRALSSAPSLVCYGNLDLFPSYARTKEAFEQSFAATRSQV